MKEKAETEQAELRKKEMIEVSMQVQEVLSRRGLLVEELDQVFGGAETQRLG